MTYYVHKFPSKKKKKLITSNILIQLVLMCWNTLYWSEILVVLLFFQHWIQQTVMFYGTSVYSCGRRTAKYGHPCQFVYPCISHRLYLEVTHSQHVKANNPCIRICFLELGTWNSYLKVYHIALIFIFPT